MSKLYALLAMLFLSLAGSNISAQNITPDVANFNFVVNAPANDVAFTNTSTIGGAPGVRRAFGSFGDGTGQWTLPLAGTQHHYQSSGTYTVCLKIYRYFTATNDSVLSAQICKTVVIETVCRANFESHDSIISLSPLKYLVRFWAIPLHNANKPVTQVCWNFGDGTDTCINITSNVPPGNVLMVQHTYLQQGPFNVCVRIKYLDGCIAEKCKPLQLPNPPQDSCRANFERLPVTSSPSSLHAAFRALPWHNGNKKPVRICWEFGDGKDTCIQYPQNYAGSYTINHTYANTGLYEVCVKIQYQGGCEARKCNPVQVGIPGTTCLADFERIQVISTNNPLQAFFKALPGQNNNQKPSRVCWKFGDGKDTCINYPANYTGQYVVGHTYNHPGQYEVCVKILYFGGCEASKCKLIEITRPDSCRADFERIPPTAAGTPSTFVFKALPWHNNDKKPTRICWQFGDGTDTCINYPANYTGQYIVAHRYNQPGSYEVCVKILYFGGCEARKCRVIVVPPPQVNCSVRIVEINPSITGLHRGFLAIPQSTPERRVERICWYFGDGKDTCIMLTPTQPLPTFFISHTYPAPGVYRACVKILYQGGCIAEDCREVVIRPASNTCGGYMIDSLIAPRTFKFKGFSVHSPNDEVLSYRWTFGDGTSALGREVAHTYNHSGEYEVCLYIKTRLGCETRICKKVRVLGNKLPALHLSPNPVVNVLHVEFISSYVEQATIKILNGFGVPVRTYVRNVTVGLNSWNFDLSNLPAGVYTFIIQLPNQLASAIFIKV